MDILVNSTELELLLERNREKIGHNSVKGIDIAGGGIAFLFSTLYTSYTPFWKFTSKQMKIAWILFGIIYVMWGVFVMITSARTKYGHKALYKDIAALNEIEHPFSLVAIKDTFREYSNRFLLRYDERWGCWLFFSYRTVEHDEANIKQRLSLELRTTISDVEYVTTQIQRKYSYSDKCNKTYTHTVYSAIIGEFNNILKQNSFEIDGTRFRWMTIADMMRDSTIMERNKEVVELIHNNIA